MPKAHSVNVTEGRERWNHWAPVPYHWYAKTSFRNPLRQQEDVNFWANSVYPYVNEPTSYEQPGVPVVPRAGADYNSPHNKPRMKVGVAFNGLLHAFPAAEIAQPRTLPVIWAGLYRQNVDGFGLSNPVLQCDSLTAGDPCGFKPLDPPQFRAASRDYGAVWWGFSAPGVHTAWVYEKGFHVATADTSVRFIEVHAPTWPAVALTNAHPFTSFSTLDEQSANPGQPHWLLDCVAPGRTKAEGLIRYPGFFRPDSEFNYTEAQCEIGD